MKNQKIKYFFDQDNDGHWYLIRADKRREWAKWLDINPDDPKAWDVPKFAEPLGSHVNCEEFYLI